MHDELTRLAAFMQSRHPIGAVKHIGLMEAVNAAMEYIEQIEGERDEALRHLNPPRETEVQR